MCFLKNNFYCFFLFIVICSCNNNNTSVDHSKKNKEDSIVEKKNLVSVRRAVAIPKVAGVPKILNVTSPFILPTNTNVHQVSEPNVVNVPERLIVITPGTDTVKLPKKIPANGKTIFCKQPIPVAALPSRFKDATICNLQYLDVDQGMNSPYVNCIFK